MDEQPTPAPAPAPLPRASHPPPPIAVQVIDQLGDLVGVVCLTYLCATGKLAGLEAGGLILSLLGVQTGVRKIAGAKTPSASGVGAVALLLLSVAALGHHGRQA